ncbi:uncharacterized protein LOC109604502 [Aethina tumida]|uniref:uncharacterized protein LOC109604502 n=1 Tax=Aethina tumida TaxID=116153 RepID=UPI002148C7C5|nr:uncharacterized protein LOC109604502 [Aethina tumida]
MDVRWSIFIRYAFILFGSLHLTATFKQQGQCFFPKHWEGNWFQSGVRQPVLIEGSRLSTKGRCLASEGDKFVMLDEKRACYRCVVIHQKHPNVLQYKETFCHGRDALPTLCSLITGDALLFSLFRENAQSVPCPFRGPFTFTYNRGHGECRSPVSSIDSCTEESRLLLSYQACPDIHSSESTVEELQCLALWKEGSSRYLVGKVHHNHATSNEDRFRCFVYEKTSPSSEAQDGVDYRVAQSGDATCNGLFSASEGSRTMTLKRAPTVNKCRFPPWVANYNHWHTLDYAATYSFHHRNSTLRITNSSGLEMRVVCSQVKYSSRDENTVILLTHFTTGCQSGFTCMSFYRRDVHVIEVQIGAHAKRQEDACGPAFFNRTNLPYVTLVTTSPETRACPYMGKFVVSNLIRSERSIYDPDSRFYFNKLAPSTFDDNLIRRVKRVRDDPECNRGFSSLIIGCNNVDTMEFRTECSTPDIITTYSCHGRWTENGTNYLITTPLSRASHGARRYCFIYKESGPDLLLFSTSGDNCDRIVRPGITGELVFNVTNTGKCIQTSSSPTTSLSCSVILVCLILNILNINNVVRVIQR